MQGNITLNKASLLNSLLYSSLTFTYDPKPTFAPARLASTKDFFKLFMQTYMDIIKN